MLAVLFFPRQISKLYYNNSVFFNYVASKFGSESYSVMSLNVTF
jgi:hypothetical protein